MNFEESFCACEDEALRFLVDVHGFRRVSRRLDRGSPADGVRAQAVYRASECDPESGREVVLAIAPLQLELALEIASTASGAFALEELHAIEATTPFPQRMHGLYDAMFDPELLRAEFTRLANVLRASGRRFFNDDPSLWDDLLARRERRADAERMQQVVAVAKQAFYARDWLLVVGLLGPIEARLGRRASARLAYARRKAIEEGL